MNKPVVTEFQPSITEWFALIGKSKDSEAFRAEDNTKNDRLEFLNQLIGLPFEKPEKFEATDLTNKTPVFQKILVERGDELCAIRLIPKKEGLPKIRNRGLSILRCYEEWYLKQKIDPDLYYAYIYPHTSGLAWSSIFVVNEYSIFGEIISGSPNQLTQGETQHELITFEYDFKKWAWSKKDNGAEKIIKATLKKIRVDGLRKQSQITKRLDSKFFHNYLGGYFETTVWPNGEIYFIDFNRLLPKYISRLRPIRHCAIKDCHDRHSYLAMTKNQGSIALTGQPAFIGKATGRVVVVRDDNIARINFPKGSILVTDNTDVRFVPVMLKAAAIITNRGNILSHAAIVARELKIPCLVNTKSATKVFKTGDLVTVDAERGTIIKLKSQP